MLEAATEIPSTNVTLEHLDEVLQSRSFVSSPRCQDFLRFVVHEVVEGRSDSIKERTIALEVFGKSIRFDPGSDSLVRVKAREVRKRLAEYYEQAPATTAVRFELPVGSYVPIIRTTVPPTTVSVVEVAGTTSAEAEPLAAAPPQEPSVTNLSRRRAIWALSAIAAGACGVGAGLKWMHHHSTNLDRLWKPVFAKETPLLIFIPLLPRTEGENAPSPISDHVGLGTAEVVSQAAQYLTNAHHPYRLRFGADLTFSQLREQPSLLLGGFSSQWTARMTRDLRFRLEDHPPNQKGAYVVDSHTGRKWGPVVSENGFADMDYSLICRLFDASSGQVIFIAAGITTFGTESAASFLFEEDLFSIILKNAPSDWMNKSFQAVIQTSIIGLTTSTPRVLETYFW